MPLKWDTKAPVVGDQYVVLGGDSGDPFEGTQSYYQRLLRRNQKPNQKPNQLKLTVLNLLKIVQDSEETKLSECYADSLDKIKHELIRLDPPLELKYEIVNHDFHSQNKTEGEKTAVENIWKNLRSKVESDGLTCGEINVGAKPGCSNMKIECHQTGIVRINCLDSLDRTTVASFFLGLQILAEQCYRLGIDLHARP